MTVPATTVNKVCLSGLNTILLADQLIAAGEADIVVAGGMESMTNAPYLLPGARAGFRIGDAAVVDSMMYDGLSCAFDHCRHGRGHREVRRPPSRIARAAMDELAARSHERAAAAQKDGRFDAEIVAVEVPQRKGDPIARRPRRGRPARAPPPSPSAGLRGAFGEAGNVTAGNASQISDGGSRRGRDVQAARPSELGVTPLGEVVGYGQVAGPDAALLHQPSQRHPQGARQGAACRVADIDLFELNEAFAAVGLASMADLGITDDDRQRQRRRHRPRPPDRRVGQPPGPAPAARAAPARRRPRRRRPLRRRRPGRRPLVQAL